MDRSRLRIASAIGFGLALLGTGLFFAGRSSEGRAAEAAGDEVTRQAEAIGQTLVSATESARVRAEALAALPVVRAAIETDLETVKDIARSGTVFKPGKNEAIELFQTRGAKTITLLRAPESASPLKVEGHELVRGETGLAVTASAVITPLYGEGSSKGVLAVRQWVALDAARERLAARELRAALVGFDTPMLLAGATADHYTLSARVPFPGGQRVLTLRAARIQVGGAGLTVFSLLLVLLGLGGGAAGVVLERRLPPPAPPPRDESATPVLVAPRALAYNLEEPLPQLVPVETASAPVAVPDELIANKYRIIESIGAGSMSVVYLAQSVQQVGVPKVVALKLLRRQPTLTPAQLLEGAQHASQIQHGNVVRVHDFGVADERFFVAMEYVEGCSAAALIEALRASGEAVPIKQSLTIALAMCRGLDAAHAAQIFHRELKPSNVLIGRHGSVKVCDFGAARPRLSPYTAPEQALGKGSDARSDVYAVGMILYELLTGVSMAENAGPPSSRRHDLPQSLDAVVAKATHASPRRRYASCAQLAADLEDVCEAVAEAPSSGVLGDWVERVRHRTLA